MNLNEYAKVVHAANIKWWQNIDTGEPIQRNPKELLSLVISEVSEALEGERKNLMDDKLPHRKMAEVEMADAYIRVLDFSAGFGYHLPEGISICGQIPTNKGEALFDMVCCLTKIKTRAHEGAVQLVIFLKMIEAYCSKHNYDLWGAIEEKMAYNATRQDHTHEARKIAGGKQF